MKMGVMGGTFDPIHNGHLRVAEEVQEKLKLDSVLFVPAGRPWMRAQEPVASPEDRREMVRIAVAGKPYFKVSDIEIERLGPSYMAETIAELKKQSVAGIVIYLILGWDAIAALPQWREPARLLEMCRLVAVKRPGYAPPDLISMEAYLHGISEKVIVLEKPEIDISASEIRERLAKGLSVGRMIPGAVVKYIREHGLYGV